MTDPSGPDAHGFRSAAPHYLTGRPAYSPALIRDVVRYCGLDASHRVLDLGCGPGVLAVALARFARDIVALDPEPAMLRLAVEHAARAGVTVRFVEAGADALDPALGSFRLVTIGRAFHWMDRVATLERLDAQIEPAGALALFQDRHPELPDNAWRQPYRELVRRYAVDGAARGAGRTPPHEAVLLGSRFSRLARLAAIERRRTPVEAFVARALSMSSTAPARLGPKADELAREIIQLMAPYATDGLVTEIVETEALIARRPAPDRD